MITYVKTIGTRLQQLAIISQSKKMDRNQAREYQNILLVLLIIATGGQRRQVMIKMTIKVRKLYIYIFFI